MPRRWLVTLAMFVVSTAGALRIEAADSRVTATAQLATTATEHEHKTMTGDTYKKTFAHLVACSPDGTVRWVRPSSTSGGVAITANAIYDGWIDRETNRFGVVKYDPRDGRVLASIELGSTRGWHDVERIEVAPDGPDDVLVSALFGVA